MAKTNSECDAVLATLDGSSFLALFEGDPAGSGVELTGNGYARQAVTWGAPTNASGGGRQRQNTNVMTFGPFSGSPSAAAPTPANITHFAIFSLVTGGTMRRTGALTSAVNNVNSGRLEAAAGSFTAKET